MYIKKKKEKKKKYAHLVFKRIVQIEEKKKTLIMIPNLEKEDWHYLTVKNLFALLHEITSKHDFDFYCLKCLLLLIT